MSSTSVTPAFKRVMTFRQASQAYPITEGGLRWMRFRDTAGFNQCVIRIGRKLLIDADALDRWLDAQRGKAA